MKIDWEDWEYEEEEPKQKICYCYDSIAEIIRANNLSKGRRPRRRRKNPRYLSFTQHQYYKVEKEVNGIIFLKDNKNKIKRFRSENSGFKNHFKISYEN